MSSKELSASSADRESERVGLRPWQAPPLAPPRPSRRPPGTRGSTGWGAVGVKAPAGRSPFPGSWTFPHPRLLRPGREREPPASLFLEAQRKPPAARGVE